MRYEVAKQMDALADVVVRGVAITTENLDRLVDACLRESPRFGEYAGNTVKQYGELATVIGALSVET